jgi:hypothetical protein
MVPHMSGTSIDAQKVCYSPESLLVHDVTDILHSVMPPVPSRYSIRTSLAARTTGLRILLYTREIMRPRRMVSVRRNKRFKGWTRRLCAFRN